MNSRGRHKAETLGKRHIQTEWRNLAEPKSKSVKAKKSRRAQDTCFVTLKWKPNFQIQMSDWGTSHEIVL